MRGTETRKATLFILSRYLCHMKQFLRIFCLYLFILSCLPCSDGEHGHGALSGGGIAMLTVPQDSHSHEHCPDFCSPFCTCTCCGCNVSTNRVAVLQLNTVNLLTSKPSSFYKSFIPDAHRSALFRPPIAILG